MDRKCGSAPFPSVIVITTKSHSELILKVGGQKAASKRAESLLTLPGFSDHFTS